MDRIAATAASSSRETRLCQVQRVVGWSAKNATTGAAKLGTWSENDTTSAVSVPSPMNTARRQRPGAGASSAHSESITASPSTRRSPAAGPTISVSFDLTASALDAHPDAPSLPTSAFRKNPRAEYSREGLRGPRRHDALRVLAKKAPASDAVAPVQLKKRRQDTDDRSWTGVRGRHKGAVTSMRKETDSLGVVDVPEDKLWGAQTQRSLEHFSIGKDLIPREMITAYAILKKGAAAANHASTGLDDERYRLIVQACDEILAGRHHDMFPLHVWMTGSGTQFNMNVNEVISNRCCQLAGTPLGSKTPVHPNDHVNMAQSSNDSFPSAMYVAAAVNVKQRLIPAVTALHDAIQAKAQEWKDIVKIGRTHMQDATPLTLGQEWSGYAGMLADDLDRIEDALKGVYRLALGGTAVGTGINSAPGFAEAAAAEIAKLTGLPFVTAPNKFTVQGAHDALVQLSGTLRTLAVSLYKI